jgi:hypothetical protein
MRFLTQLALFMIRSGNVLSLRRKMNLSDVAFLPSASARRVRRSEVSSPAFLKPDGLDYCLDCWKSWMGRNDTDLGIKAQSTLKADGDGFGSEDTSQMRRDNEISEATDAMVHSLKTSHQWAIRRKCGIANAWRFPQLDYMTEALDACDELEKKLRNNVATRLLW